MRSKKNINKIHDINYLIECPICIEETDEYFTLNCGHSFCTYCIQRLIYDCLLRKSNNKCAICRSVFIIKDVKKIFKKWNLLIDYVNLDWGDTQIKQLNKAKIKQFSKINFENTQEKFVYILPLYKQKIINTPKIFESPLLSNLYFKEFINYRISSIFGKTQSYDEVEPYRIFFKSNMEPRTKKIWKKYYSNIISKINTKKKIVSPFNFQENVVFFNSHSYSSIKSYDIAFGEFNNFFMYKENRKFKINFNTIMFETKTEYIILNILKNIMYV